ncbi:MAG TPA: hypothetical protein VNO26_06450 [Candidatus Limnocylindria bacterium]|nr:hypothetical protein [Candidatus Limnocylindria bacterium]
MTRSVLALALTAFLVAAPVAALAADPATPAPQAEAAMVEEGCMPGGGCCGGSAACPKAERGPGKMSGGCPCQKAKQQAAEQQKQPAAP